MPEYLHPGVYIEEIERGPRPIEGVPTSTAAFLGQTERGPTRPRLVTSYNDYKRWFGGVFGDGARFMPYAVSGFFENGGKRLYVCRIVGENAAFAANGFGPCTVTAQGAGTWGNQVWVKVSDSTTRDAQNQPVGFRLQVAYWSSVPPNFTPFNPFDPANRRSLPRPALTEDFDDLVTSETAPDYYRKRLESGSALVSLDGPPNVRPDAGEAMLSGGQDDATAIGVDDFVGEPAGTRTDPQGLDALKLDAFREVALVYAPHPAQDSLPIAKAVIDHCELKRFRFGVIDCERNEADVGNLDPRTDISETSYAAFYYPWLYVSDPQTGARKLVPPGGHALGIYARTDAERGVFKAPANEVARGVLALEFDIDDGRQDVLNPRGVNVIRSFPGRGIRVWGARTLSANSLWKYVSVRRLFIFLENSIYEGTQWVVFEPNDDRLWARVKDTIRLFLRGQWRLGALFGRTEDEAFFITCDRTTMTQDDILNGRLICEIGIAPVRPAEFVVFRIFQNTAEAQR
jgi:phage tail sheath protein FI